MVLGECKWILDMELGNGDWGLEDHVIPSGNIGIFHYHMNEPSFIKAPIIEMEMESLHNANYQNLPGGMETRKHSNINKLPNAPPQMSDRGRGVWETGYLSDFFPQYHQVSFLLTTTFTFRLTTPNICAIHSPIRRRNLWPG